MKTVTFAIDLDPIAPGQAEVFGEAFAGQFIARVPRLDEVRGAIPLRITARCQAEGVETPSGTPIPAYSYIHSRAWLDTLCTTVPEWYEPVRSGEAEDDDVLFSAVLTAYRQLADALASRKKKSPATSAE